jgi:hypothetical protein
MRGGQELFEEVVARSGLAAWVGPGTVRRALVSVGVSSPDVASPNDYLRALPELQARMATYLGASDLKQRMDRIETLLRKK